MVSRERYLQIGARMAQEVGLLKTAFRFTGVDFSSHLAFYATGVFRHTIAAPWYYIQMSEGLIRFVLYHEFGHLKDRLRVASILFLPVSCFSVAIGIVCLLLNLFVSIILLVVAVLMAGIYWFDYQNAEEIAWRFCLSRLGKRSFLKLALESVKFLRSYPFHTEEETVAWMNNSKKVRRPVYDYLVDA